MKIRQVARFFDRSAVTDPFTGAPLFRAQFSNYDESKRDAFTAYRRIMSLAPELQLPPHRTISALGETWMAGDGHPDGWSDLHRRKFVVHRASGGARVWSIGEYLAGGPPVDTFGDIQWIVDRAEEEVSSARPQLYVAILPDVIDVAPHSLVEVGPDLLFVQSSAHHASGFMEARGYLQPRGQSQQISLVGRVYSPVTGGYVEQATATVKGLKVRWQEMYSYGNQLDARYQEGDATFIVPLSLPVSTSSRIVHEGRPWTILGVKAVDGARHLHGRPAT